MAITAVLLVEVSVVATEQVAGLVVVVAAVRSTSPTFVSCDTVPSLAALDIDVCF